MPGNTTVSTIETHRRRLLFLAALLVAITVLLTMRLTQWQIVDHEKLLAASQGTHKNTVVLPPQRGEIRDRNGHILAISLREDLVQGDPTFFQKQRPSMQDYIVKTASSILNLPAEQIRQQLLSGTGYYTKIRDTVPLTISKAINDAGISPAIAAVPKERRFYPSHALLAHTIGFINGEGDGIGIEGSYDDLLQGVAGERVYEGETYGVGLAQIPSITPPLDGADITLTIDINIQYVAERELERALYAEKTQTGTVVVLDPKTGEILAMAGRPTFDPNAYSNVPPRTWANPVIVDAWEPGSILKILTLSAALDAGKITPDTIFYDRGKFRYGRAIITDRDDQTFGNINPAQILQYSSNIGTVQVADVLSTTAFYTYMHAFGITQKTGVDLPFEAEGQMRMTGDMDWSLSDLATQSFGQSLTATPLQMAVAVAAVANKGIMMRPYVVARSNTLAATPDGPGPIRRVIRAETAAQMTDMLVSVTETTVKQARVPGYHLAGKTGTALIPPPMGSYTPSETIASFVGYGPAEDPRFVILVRIDLPRVHETGAEAAAPVFKNIAQYLLTYMKIPPYDLRAQATP